LKFVIYIVAVVTILDCISNFGKHVFKAVLKKTLMIPKGQQVVVNRVKTYNTMAKRKRTNTDLQSTAQNLEIE
jgi:hypothetical protein